MECQQQKNLEACTCTRPGCPRKGKCCECVAHHRRGQGIPACFFPPAGEKTFDRSVENFIKFSQ